MDVEKIKIEMKQRDKELEYGNMEQVVRETEDGNEGDGGWKVDEG